MSLRFGFFRSFKGDDTLLIWGDDDFGELRDLFENLGSGWMKSIDFEATRYLRPVGSCSVNVSRLEKKVGEFTIKTSDCKTVIKLYLTLDELKDFSVKVDNISKHQDTAVHQYLDIESVQPFQIMVAKGEYPSDLDPDA